jgi:hypothetical protein
MFYLLRILKVIFYVLFENIMIVFDKKDNHFEYFCNLYIVIIQEIIKNSKNGI